MECLKTKTGSCKGCGVAQIAESKLHENGVVRDRHQASAVATRIQAAYCPESQAMQVEAILPDQPRSGW